MNFERNWTKLKLKLYMTIRSPNYLKDHKLAIGKIEKVSLKGKFNHNAKVLAFEDKKIKDIPLIFLQFDVHPIEIDNHEGFVKIMNDMVLTYKGYPGKNTINTIKSIIWFENKGYF